MSTRVAERRVSRVPLSHPGLIHGLRQTFSRWMQRARTRRQLDALSDHELRDLGIGRSDAFHESTKPFWKG